MFAQGDSLKSTYSVEKLDAKLSGAGPWPRF